MTLSPSSTYVLAQGGLDGDWVDFHYLVLSLNASDVVNGSPIIETWHPGNLSLIWPIEGSANIIVGMAPEGGSGNKPAI